MKDYLTLLTYLKSILSAGSLTGGAESLFVSQPYLSNYIIDAEKELGFMLLNRSKRPITLTDQGARFLQGIESLNLSYQKLLSNVLEMNISNVKKLRIGANQSMASLILPPALYRYQNEYPEQQIIINEDRSKDLEQALLKDELDFHIRMLPIFPSEIGYTLLAEIPIYLIVNKSSDLFEKGNTRIRTLSINKKSLVKSEFISIESGSGFMRLVELFLAQKGVNIYPKFETKYMETAANMAYQGLGCTFIPKYFITSNFNSSLCNIINIPKSQLSLKIVLSYLKRKNLEEEADRFISATNIQQIVTSMNIYQYEEILK